MLSHLQRDALTLPQPLEPYLSIRRGHGEMALSCVGDAWTPAKSAVGVMAVCQKEKWLATNLLTGGSIRVVGVMEGKIPGSYTELRFLAPWYEDGNQM